MFRVIIFVLLLSSIPITPTPLLETSQNANLEPQTLFEEEDNEDLPFSFPFLSDPYIKPGTIIKLRKLVNSLKAYYLPSGRQISEQCDTVLSGFTGKLVTNLKSWRLKMVDSWGKLLDGFLFGNIHPVGMFEECLQIEAVESEIPFKGKYCKIFHEADDSDSSDISRSGPGVAIINPTPITFFYATCIPSVCTNDDLAVSLNKTFANHGRKVAKLECHTPGVSDHTTEFDGFDAFVTSLIILLIVLAIFGTIIDENNLQRFTITDGGKRFFNGLACFSITKSFKHIFGYRKEASEAITCVHGLRVITLIWIITCHQYETAIDFIVNLLNAKKYQDPIFGQFITDGYQSVDTFFTLSGILLAYRLFPSILSGKDFTGIVFLKGYCISLFRRIIRLFPSILMVAMFSATLIRFLGFGPNEPQLDRYSEQCRETWWKDPLFVDNLIFGDDKTVLTNDCLDHCWYTAVEMQLFLIVPFVFLPRIYNKFVGFIWLFFLTLLSQVIPLIIMIIYEFPPVLFPYLTFEESYDFYTKYYKAPWCRSAPWFIGIWTGIILVKYPHYLKRLNKMHIIIGYAIAIILGIVIVIGLYRYNHVGGKHHEISNALSGVYGFFSRPLWAIAVCWVVITCYTKNAWYVNAILSWWGWQPLSRLTFSMYLVSPVVQVWWANSLFVPIYYSYIAKLFETCGVFFISFVMAVLLSTLVEGPILRLTESALSSKVLKSTVTKKQHESSA